jgi:hypothetical protein
MTRSPQIDRLPAVSRWNHQSRRSIEVRCFECGAPALTYCGEDDDG